MVKNIVVVYANDGQRIANTTPRNAKILLKSKKAKVVNTIPFSIQLFFPTGKTGACNEYL